MATRTLIVIKPINADRLMEELTGLPVTSVTWAGFVRDSDGRTYRPFEEATRVVGRSSLTGDDVASQGELRFVSAVDLTAGEIAQLEAFLMAHDATRRSAEQVRQDQDDTDFTELRTLYNVGSLSNAQVQRAVHLLLRLLIRSRRSEAI